MAREDQLNFSEQRRVEIATELWDCIQQAESDRQPLLSRVAEWRKQRAQDMPKAKADWPFVGASEVCLPSTRNAIRATRDRLSRAMFSIEPYFLYRSRNAATEQVANGLERLLHWRCQRCLNLKARADEAFDNSLTDSTAWAVVKFERKQHTVRSRRIAQAANPVINDLTGEPLYQNGSPLMSYGMEEIIEPETVTTYSGPTLTIEPIENIGVYPSAAVKLDEVTGYYRRISKSMREWRIGERAGRYRNVEQLEGQPMATSQLTAQKESETGVSASPSQPLPDSAIRSAWECVWKWEVDGEYEWVVFMVAEGAPVLMQARKFPYWHNRPFYVPLRPSPKSGSFYGWSIAEELEQLQKIENALWRQHLDAGTLSNALTIAARRQAGYRWQKFQAAPGKINYFDDPANVQQFRFDQPSDSQLTALGITHQYIQRTSSLSDLAMGGFPGQEVKATEVNVATAGAGVTFEQMLNRLQNGSGELGCGEGLNEIARQVMALDYQFIGDTDIPAREVGFNPFEGVSLGELLYGYDLEAAGSTSVENKELEKQSRMAFVNWLSSHPLFGPLVQRYPGGAWEMLSYVAESHDNLSTVEQWVGTKEQATEAAQAEQERQEKMQQMQLQMAMQEKQFEQGIEGAELELKKAEAERKELETMLNARAKGEDLKTRVALAEAQQRAQAKRQEGSSGDR